MQKKRFQFISLLFVLLIFSIQIMAQKQWHECGQTEMSQNLINQHPELKDKMLKIDKAWAKRNASSTNFQRKANYTIPVVVHIINSVGSAGIDDAQVNRAIEFLNQSYANQAPYDPSVGVDTGIEFCLATMQPDGTPTDGINRVESNLSLLTMETQDLELKNLIKWNAECYCNIYVVDQISSVSSGSGVAGYAYFPNAHGEQEDGVVIEASFFGTDSERTAVLSHELGHYLGLYHTFQGGCRNVDCAVDGDRICDTPPDQSTAAVDCGEVVNTCDTDPQSGFSSDENDLTKNFMDYGEPKCLTMFTPDQAARMHFTLDSIRSSLLECNSCGVPCGFYTADFDLGGTVFNAGTVFNTSNNSVNGQSFEWLIDGVFYSNARDTSFQFSESGSYKITLVTRGAFDYCTQEITECVEIICPISVNISGIPDTCIFDGSNFQLTFSGTPTANIRWFSNDNFIGSGSNLSHDFAPGSYQVKAVATDGFCRDSLTQMLLVGCVEICDNNIDDDADGLIDCYDDDCCEQCDDFWYRPCIEPGFCDCSVGNLTETWRSEFSVSNFISPVVGDIDSDGENEIVTTARVSGSDIIGIFDKDGFLDFANTNFRFRSANAVFADVTGDGKAEIFGIMSNISTGDKVLACFDNELNIIYETEIRGSTSAVAELHIRDFNEDGKPEIQYAARIYDALSGTEIIRFPTGMPFGYHNPEHTIVSSSIADILPDDFCLNCDGLEIITANAILSIDISTQTVNQEVSLENLFIDGAATVADIDLDGDLDVFGATYDYSDKPHLVVWEGQSPTILFDKEIPVVAGQFGLPQFIGANSPTIANFDNDPFPEFVFTVTQSYIGESTIQMYDHDFSELWVKKLHETSQTTPIAFDFCNDGISEFIFNGYDSLQIFNGDGTVLTGITSASFTLFERPIIVDLDKDGHADILTNGGISHLYRPRMAFFSGADFGWAATRTEVNQRAILNTNINTDLTIPAVLSNNLLLSPTEDFNSYNSAYSFWPIQPDVELTGHLEEVKCEGDYYDLSIRICSGGTNVPTSIPITFYSENPFEINAQIIDNQSITLQNLTPGGCISVNVQIPATAIVDSICIAINEDGTTNLPFVKNNLDLSGVEEECNYLDNISCQKIELENLQFDIFNDTIICQNSDFRLEGPSGFTDYKWSTGATDSFINISTSGTYSLCIHSVCSLPVCDTATIEIYSAPSLNLPDSIDLCSRGVIELKADLGFKNYRWQDGSIEPNFTAWEFGKYWVETTDFCENIYIDTTVISQLDRSPIVLPDSITICGGLDTILSLAPLKNIKWYSTDLGLSCNHCEEVQITPSSSQHLYVEHISDDGCFSKDSVYFSVIPFNSPGDLIKDTIACDLAGVNLEVPGIWQNYSWSDGSSGTSILVNQAGTYTVCVENACGVSFCDTSEVAFYTPPMLAFPDSVTTCPFENIQLEIDSNFTTYLWSDGSTGYDFQTNQSGIVWVEVTDECGKILTDTVTIFQPNLPTINLPDTIELCEGIDTILSLVPLVDVNWAGNNFGLSCTNCNEVEVSPTSSDILYVEHTTAAGCLLKDSVYFSVTPFNSPGDLIKDTLVCDLAGVNLEVPGIWQNYSWSDGSSGTSILVNQAGTYTVCVENACGVSFCDTSEVAFYTAPMLAFPDSVTTCPFENIQLEIDSNFTTYLWSDGSTGYDFQTNQSAIVWVEVTDECGKILSDTVTIFQPTLPTINLPDTIELCEGTDTTLSVLNFTSINWTGATDISCNDCFTLRITGSASETVFVNAETEIGCVVEDSVFLLVQLPSQIFDTLFICEGDSVFLENVWQKESGDFINPLIGKFGCDSIIYTNLQVENLLQINREISICPGDSVFLENAWRKTAGVFQEISPSVQNCDTTWKITLEVFDSISPEAIIINACPNSEDGEIQIRLADIDRYTFLWNDNSANANLSEKSAGNYSLTVTDENQCFERFSYQIQNFPILETEVVIEQIDCDTTGLAFIEFSGLTLSEIYQIDGGQQIDSGFVYSELLPGIYDFQLIDTNNCEKDEQIIIEEIRLLNFQIQDTFFINSGESARLNITGDTGEDGLEIQFLNPDFISCADCFAPVSTPDFDIEYEILITDKKGCIYNLKTYVKISESIAEDSIYMPSAFSPNNDGINDILKIYASDSDCLIDAFRVFDRWGELLYEEKSVTFHQLKGWDGTYKGKPMDPAVFLIQLEYECGQIQKTFAGDVTLLR